MTTKRNGLKENRESFEEAKERAAYEKEIDRDKLHVAQEKLEREIKKSKRDYK